MLVIDERVFDKNIEHIRYVQNELLSYVTPDDCRVLSRILDQSINDLNHNSIDLIQSIIRGQQEIIKEM